jgi:DnaJ-class molecular chaperone
MDYYETLGVNHTTQPDEIKRAYKKLASKHHPDKGGDAEEFKKIQKA